MTIFENSSQSNTMPTLELAFSRAAELNTDIILSTTTGASAFVKDGQQKLADVEAAAAGLNVTGGATKVRPFTKLGEDEQLRKPCGPTA